ncbi:hypothetical protein CFAM422_005825 [Trichoderma lentiforme]|uniref:Uncharacterized protein n=1 Tax=Trichoderma lentiforme TaxID=1567552 RepID=A0A9P4XFW2_9HYPO|nr:hypothetical protein CFAM422_005825 [Trichoderma lentiforme]
MEKGGRRVNRQADIKGQVSWGRQRWDAQRVVGRACVVEIARGRCVGDPDLRLAAATGGHDPHPLMKRPTYRPVKHQQLGSWKLHGKVVFQGSSGMDALASPLDWGTRSATGGLQVLAAPSNAVVGLSGTAAKLGGQRGLSLTGLFEPELSDFAP